MKTQCICGADLVWETRETPKGKLCLALCVSPMCGSIAASAYDPEPENVLAAFLFGEDQVPEREDVHEWDFNDPA
jgi:hypothetical protein